MEYNVQLMPLGKLVNPELIKEGTLCDSCQCYDCSNPIVNLTVSVIGINKRMRIWKNGSNRHAVVKCDGYRKDTVIEENEEND